MALKTQFPLFATPQHRPEPQRPPTEIRFSRWNNANAQKFIRRGRDQKEIEDRLRFEKRFDAAFTIAHNYNPAPPHPTTFKSIGTPSEPSSPSIPGKKSKYSKPPNPAYRRAAHPAFKTLVRPRKIPARETESEDEGEHAPRPSFKIDENGVSYELPEAPFVYQYSYTETPKLKPVKLREPLVSPFGPSTMAKPWLGRKPMSKKKLPEFDSFKLPPPQKKGVKPIQAPGPFLPGSGPKYVNSREDILGDPLTKEEIAQLINGSVKSRRQLNMGRDGLTHNMLDNVHALWKRRRVCRIKCKGVCTVDMENVCQQLEEKTGGKIIYSKGGVLYLFRGRNYNFKTRPRYPLMLWKPASPVYPRLVKGAPEGLTLKEAIDMRKRGRDLIPITKLAKNGLYIDLVKNVKEAFEACELVRIDCQGLNPSDFKKIGAKLQTLVPCVLLSFEREHILIWRGRDWKSSFVERSQSPLNTSELKDDVVTSGPFASPSSNDPSISIVEAEMNFIERIPDAESPVKSIEIGQEKKVTDVQDRVPSVISNVDSINEPEGSLVMPYSSCRSEEVNQTIKSEKPLIVGSEKSRAILENAEPDDLLAEIPSTVTQFQEELINTEDADLYVSSGMPHYADGVLLLMKQAVENKMAFVLDDHSLDADAIFKQAITFSKTAPSGPVFRLRTKKVASQENTAQKPDDSERKEAAPVVSELRIAASGRREKRTVSRTGRTEYIKADQLNIAPQGSLRVDELAKLLV